MRSDHLNKHLKIHANQLQTPQTLNSLLVATTAINLETTSPTSQTNQQYHKQNSNNNSSNVNGMSNHTSKIKIENEMI